MSYKVIRNSFQQPIVVLQDEPSYCKSLQAAPITREPELNRGVWLILVFAAWSMPDITAIETALETAKYFEGVIQLGLRPFDSWKEHLSWCAAIENSDSSPIWLLLNNGEIIMERTGLHMKDALIEAISRTGVV